MTSLLNKIELLIKREKTTPDRKKDDSKKSSSEILSELFSAFNADPPKISDISIKKAKKTKKKHKKEKKRKHRSRSNSSDSNKSDNSYKRKKRKKGKSGKHRESRSPSSKRSRTPARIKKDPESPKESYKIFHIKTEDNKVKDSVKNEKTELKPVKHVKTEEPEDLKLFHSTIDTSRIPLPDSPKEEKPETNGLQSKPDKKEMENEKAKGKIQIKNLKFSTVFEETVKKAEEEARKRAEKYEEGEYSDSSSSSAGEYVPNLQFPKTSDPGGLKRKATEDSRMAEEEKSISKKSKASEIIQKSSHKDRSRSRKRSSSRSRRSKSRSPSRRYRYRSTSKSRRRSRSRHRSTSRSRRRSRSRNRIRHISPRHRGRRSRSPSGVKLADSEKKRLLEVARRNAINMLKNGAVPAGAAALPPHTRNQVMAAIQSGGKSVDELTDFCKHLSKKEALGELSSVSSNDDDMSENEDTLAFHHPFLVKEKAPIVMNIRGGAPLPIKTNTLPVANKEELRLQFPVSSGSQHREKAGWVPVSPKKDNMQIAKLNSKPNKSTATVESSKCEPVPSPAVPLPVPVPLPLPVPPVSSPPYKAVNSQALQGFTSGSQLSSVPPALPAPGPQAYPPGIVPPKIDVASIVSQKLLMIRKEQEENELMSTCGFGWSKDSSLGQFTGSTGAQILTPRELASGTQAWAKKDQLVRAAPVEGGMGMHLLQKMGWAPGQGLGKGGTGALQPLLLEVKLDTRGLSAKEEDPHHRRHARALRTQAPLAVGLKQSRPTRGRGMAAPLVAGGKHPVSLLGEYCSKKKIGPPEYSLCFECGPDHKKNFLFKVRVAGVEYQPAVASANKKQAKADAAQLALQKLGIVS